MIPLCEFSVFFFFNDTATTEIYTLSLHDALPIFSRRRIPRLSCERSAPRMRVMPAVMLFLLVAATAAERSEEHTSELQSRPHLVCRLLLEKKKKAERQLADSLAYYLRTASVSMHG